MEKVGVGDGALGHGGKAVDGNGRNHQGGNSLHGECSWATTVVVVWYGMILIRLDGVGVDGGGGTNGLLPYGGTYHSTGKKDTASTALTLQCQDVIPEQDSKYAEQNMNNTSEESSSEGNTPKPLWAPKALSKGPLVVSFLLWYHSTHQGFLIRWFVSLHLWSVWTGWKVFLEWRNSGNAAIRRVNRRRVPSIVVDVVVPSFIAAPSTTA